MHSRLKKITDTALHVACDQGRELLEINELKKLENDFRDLEIIEAKLEELNYHIKLGLICLNSMNTVLRDVLDVELKDRLWFLVAYYKELKDLYNQVRNSEKGIEVRENVVTQIIGLAKKGERDARA